MCSSNFKQLCATDMSVNIFGYIIYKLDVKVKLSLCLNN
jgi:hypothetical protein